jgi:hypothetical protein
MDELHLKDRRSGKDRRAAPTSPFTLKSLFGARTSSRRKEDFTRYYFFDRYSPFFVILLIVTLLLSLFDAFLTLRLMDGNFRELNPVMEYFINLGPSPFLLVKWLLTVFGLLTLLILKNFYLWGGKIKAETILVVIPFLYLVLITYEIVLVVNQ